MKRVLIILPFISLVLCAARQDPLVKIDKGLVKGLQATDGDYAMFMGIPYAKVNASNPFGQSLPYPDFEGVFEANDDSVVCPQLDELTREITGSLDCLLLHVYVPNKATTKNRLPVLVWIHGGGFRYSSGNRELYGPKFLMEKDVILVTINYRLGPYGFMCLDTADVPGNQGLKDQLTALRWIKNNIEAFGGDANKLTVFGESAGAGSVDFHMLSAQEKLYDQVILQSGNALAPWAIVDSDVAAPVTIAKHLGFDRDDLDGAMAFLATVEPLRFITAVTDLSITFWPCVEKEFEGVERLVADYPINSKVPKEKRVPVLAGFNSNEMLWTYGNKPAESYLESDAFKQKLGQAFHLREDGELEKVMSKFYIGDEEQSIDLKQELINFESDAWYNYPSHSYVQRNLAVADKIYYYYIFSHAGSRNFVKYHFNITGEGAAHADELSYLFDPTRFIKEEPTEEDRLVIDRITTLWTNFAKYGDPTPETSDLLPVKWIPVTEEHMTYLDINNDLTLKRRPFNDRMAFWELFCEVYKNSIKGYDRDQ